jgi:hypothetical protein
MGMGFGWKWNGSKWELGGDSREGGDRWWNSQDPLLQDMLYDPNAALDTEDGLNRVKQIWRQTRQSQPTQPSFQQQLLQQNQAPGPDIAEMIRKLIRR